MHLKFAGVLQQQIQQQLVIGWRRKNRLAVIAPLDDVVRVAGQSQAGQACHDAVRKKLMRLLTAVPW